MHDDTQLVRVQQMALAIKEGQFPVRWVKDLGYGYGYPIFNFYNPLPYYVGSLPVLLGIDPLTGTKLMFALPIFLGGLGIFVLLTKRYGQSAAILASVLYTYAPYHAVQIYVRGSVAEYWAYAVIPWLLYFLLRKSLLGSAISLAALILSHNLTAIMAIPFLGLFILVNFFLSKNKLLFLILNSSFLILALGLSAFFWLPATVEKNLTNVDAMVEQQFNPLDHFVHSRQLLYSPWGFGGSSPTEHDGLSFMIGSVHLLLLISAGVLYIIRHRKLDTIIISSLLLTFVSIFMLLPISRQVWILGFRLLKYIQFPWRYLSFSLIGISILGALTVFFLRLKSDLLHLLTGVLICITILVNIQYFQPQFKYAETVDQLLTEEKIKWEYSGRSDEYLPKGFIRPQSAEIATSTKDPHNQQLVDQLLQPTPLRTTSNYISLTTLVILVIIGKRTLLKG